MRLVGTIAASILAMPIAFASGMAGYDELLSHKDFDVAASRLASDRAVAGPDRQYIEGVLANRAGNAVRSTALLAPIRKQGHLTAEREATMLQTLGDDYAKVGNYAQSADAYEELLRRFGNTLSERARRTASENAGVFGLLRTARPQELTSVAQQTISLTSNRLGLQEIPVRVGGKDESWVLDTGANISVLPLSTARALGLTISRGTTQTEGLTGDPVSVHAATIPDLQVGSAHFHNVAVLVTDDAALSAGGTQLRGVIGFPVLAALQRLTFRKESLTFGGTSPSGGSRMFLDEMTPLLAASVKGATHLYTLDTGANRTVLSTRYAQAYAAQLGKAQVGERQLTGVGGSRKVPSYVHVTTTLLVGGAAVQLQDIDVLRSGVGTEDDNFYGILGRDFLKQLKSYTISFSRMTFSAER